MALAALSHTKKSLGGALVVFTEPGFRIGFKDVSHSLTAAPRWIFASGSAQITWDSKWEQLAASHPNVFLYSF